MDTMTRTLSEPGSRRSRIVRLPRRDSPETGPDPLPELCHRIQRAQPPAFPQAPPPRPQDHRLAGHVRVRCPLLLVAIVAAQKVERAVAMLNRALNHYSHQHLPDAFPLPPRVAAALVEVHGAVGGKAVPSRRRLPVQVQRDKPQLLSLRHLAGERTLQALGARVAERSSASTVPALLVQPQQVAPPFVEPVFVVIDDSGSMISKETALFAPQDLPAVGGERSERGVPRSRKLERRAAPERSVPHSVATLLERVAEMLCVQCSFREVAEDDHLP